MTAFVNPTTGGPEGPSVGASSSGPAGPTGGPAYGWHRPSDTYGFHRLYRSTTNRVWAGVCAGFAEHFGWDPSVTRVAYALLALMTGIFPMLVAYVVMAMVIPDGPSPAEASDPSWRPDVYRRGSGSGAIGMVFGLLLVFGGGVALAQRYLTIDWSWAGPATAIVLGIFLILLAMTRRSA